MLITTYVFNTYQCSFTISCCTGVTQSSENYKKHENVRGNLPCHYLAGQPTSWGFHHREYIRWVDAVINKYLRETYADSVLRVSNFQFQLHPTGHCVAWGRTANYCLHFLCRLLYETIQARFAAQDVFRFLKNPDLGWFLSHYSTRKFTRAVDLLAL